MTAYDADLDGAVAASRNGRPEVTTDKGKLVLPPLPARDDLAGLCAWLTVVFDLDPTRPVTGAAHLGLAGADGHAVVTRAGAPDLSFEPASRISTATKLAEALNWQLQPTDGVVRGFTNANCRDIGYVVRVLCGAVTAMTSAQHADAVVSTFTSAATPVHGLTTYGTTSQRYEAAVALRRDEDPNTGRRYGPARYLIDANTGELVIAVSELQEAARRHEGASLPRGWLDARVEAAGWRRVVLEGYGLPGRTGRKGPHARLSVYRGHVLAVDGDDPVNT